MSNASRPTGHLQVKLDWNRRTRSYWAYWRDQDGERRGRRLGPAHVRDSGRRTSRGAILWRAGNGPRPTPEHLTPKDAEERLEAILEDLSREAEPTDHSDHAATLFEMTQGWVAERKRDKDLKRTTLAGYEAMFERLYRDFGADTPIEDFASGRLRPYFDDFKSYKVIGEKTANKARSEGRDVRLIDVERWTAQPADSAPVEVATKAEAVRLADQLPGTWRHLRRGAYRLYRSTPSARRPSPMQKRRRLKPRDGW